jgi:hypothetical protein
MFGRGRIGVCSSNCSSERGLNACLLKTIVDVVCDVTGTSSLDLGAELACKNTSVADFINLLGTSDTIAAVPFDLAVSLCEQESRRIDIRSMTGDAPL